MWHVGIDLHRATVVFAAVNDVGEAMNPITIPCSDTVAIASTVKALGSFRAVIEACGTYRWLYDLLRPHGSVLLAHPMRLRAMIQRRTKTDKLDARLLAKNAWRECNQRFHKWKVWSTSTASACTRRS